jgi:hypothetical protein
MCVHNRTLVKWYTVVDVADADYTKIRNTLA